VEHENFDQWGLAAHEHWTNKSACQGRHRHGIDQVYDEVRSRFGVLGGNIIGAGGGGFLMLYRPVDNGQLEDFMMSRGMPRPTTTSGKPRADWKDPSRVAGSSVMTCIS